jgi:hypothetical protein
MGVVKAWLVPPRILRIEQKFTRCVRSQNQVTVTSFLRLQGGGKAVPIRASDLDVEYRHDGDLYGYESDIVAPGAMDENRFILLSEDYTRIELGTVIRATQISKLPDQGEFQCGLRLHEENTPIDE